MAGVLWAVMVLLVVLIFAVVFMIEGDNGTDPFTFPRPWYKKRTIPEILADHRRLHPESKRLRFWLILLVCLGLAAPLIFALLSVAPGIGQPW